jgi:hypothetical protein
MGRKFSRWWLFSKIVKTQKNQQPDTYIYNNLKPYPQTPPLRVFNIRRVYCALSWCSWHPPPPSSLTHTLGWGWLCPSTGQIRLMDSGGRFSKLFKIVTQGWPRRPVLVTVNPLSTSVRIDQANFGSVLISRVKLFVKNWRALKIKLPEHKVRHIITILDWKCHP